ncbi:MAG: hypothetical protein QF464_04995 [Myxococcota bacterium]|jgi:hypothetical protein|nr:hypothetical protein [Myxococcota bacterium]
MRGPLVALLLVTALSPAAQSAVCAGGPTYVTAPIRAPRSATDAGDFGVIPEACAGGEVVLDVAGALTVAVEKFYGGLSTGVTVRGRYAFSDRLWLSLSAPGLAFDLLANATMTATSLRPTATTLGVHYAMFPGEVAQVSPYLRVLIPTDGRRQGAVRAGLELGAAFVVSLHDWVQLTGGVGFPVTETVMGHRRHTVSTPTLGLDVVFRPVSWFAMLGGLGARFTADGEEPVESLDPRFSLRFIIADAFIIDLSGAAPVVGRDLTDVSILLSLGWSLD